MFWLPTDPNRRGQYRLRPFYIGSYVLLVFEAFAAVAWIVQMFILKFHGDAQYRLTNALFLFHFGAPVALSSIVQQAQNNNSVLWWNLFVFLTAFFGDLETVLEISIQNITQVQLWAWRFVLAQACINILLTLSSFVWYLMYRKYLPKSIVEKKQPLLQNYQY